MSEGFPPPVVGRRPGRGWESVTRGIHVPVGCPALYGWQLLLPADGCFTHLTAARVRGWWLPPLPEDLPVFVSMGSSDARPVRAGVHSMRLTRPAQFELIKGLRTASAPEILLACARHLGVMDLCVLIEGAVMRGDATLAGLRSHPLKQRKGAPALRAALRLADDRSESPWETLLRLMHVSFAIDVQPQYDVIVDGQLLARGDLWLVGTRTLHEYDGAEHLAKGQQRKDLRRSRRLDRAGWTRRGFTNQDVLHRAGSILRDADAATGRPHQPERVRAWNELLRGSLFTPAGQRRLLGQLGN